MDSETRRKEFQNTLEQLKTPLQDLRTLLCLLSALLEAYGLLPPRYRVYLDSSTGTLGSLASTLLKTLPQVQNILLANILPTWDVLLNENGNQDLVDQFFVPDAFSNASSAAGSAALSAYGVLLVTLAGKQGQPSLDHAVRILERLVKEYPIDRMYRAVLDASSTSASSKRDMARGNQQWEDCVKDLCMIPAKVANAMSRLEGRGVPDVLENASYFSALSIRLEELAFSLSSASNASKCVEPLSYLFQKLVNIGLFPPNPPISRSQPSFFFAILPRIRQRLASSSFTYNSLWQEILLNLPALTLQSILTSLFGSLPVMDSSINPLMTDSKTRALIKREAVLLDNLVGKLTPVKAKERTELWDITTSLMLSKNWNETYARIFVCWVSGGAVGTVVNLAALEAFFEIVLEHWGSSEHIKHSLISRHHYTTLLFLLTASYFPPSSSNISSLISNATFIRGISTYISHLDVSVRRCGMLAAEVIANLTGKKLEFGGWDGDEGNKKWVRDVRALIEKRDIDAKLELLEDGDGGQEDTTEPKISQVTESIESKPTAVTLPTSGYDSDDSLTGYASPSSSRSPSPTPSSLDEIEKDPTLNVGRKKVPRPVYLAQLGDLLRGTGTQMQNKADDPHEADKIEMALAVGEELIRRKSNYGTELDENAVNLVYAFIGLNDNFDLDGFSEKRQGALNALIFCSPRKAAPSLIEEFFKNQYSTDQRFVALNALALGARELASLPTPSSMVPPERIAFPSKKLPAHLHHKYISENHANTDVIPLLMDNITKSALKDEQVAVETQPEVIRERRLRIQKPPTRITEVIPQHPLNPYSNLEHSIPKPKTRFIDVAAEFFTVPLVNRFWSFLRDEQAREERTSSREGRGRYHGAGTGLIMNPVVLAQFLRTLAILVNASQNAPEWLALIAPDALELALTIGTRPISHIEMAEDEPETEEQRKMKEASVLTSSLELALVVLDGALEIDGGKILGLEHTTLVLGTGEWAGKVFASLEKGLKVQGGGGMHEAMLNRAAAGVLLKVDELSSKWRRSMLDLR